jgi:hypothetical protein
MQTQSIVAKVERFAASFSWKGHAHMALHFQSQEHVQALQDLFAVKRMILEVTAGGDRWEDVGDIQEVILLDAILAVVRGDTAPATTFVERFN